MKILITGSTGMLGYTVAEYFTRKGYTVATLNRNSINFATCSFNDLNGVVVAISPQVIINCAGMIKQRTNVSTADFIKVNSVLPNWLAAIANDLNIPMIHPTTDCIFSGQKGGYTENDPMDVTDIYGVSKYLGEFNTATIIRSSIVGEEKQNQLSLLEWVRSNRGKTVKGFTNHYWNGITCHKMAQIMEDIISKNLFWRGPIHVFSNDVTKAELVTIISKVYDLGVTVEPVGGDKYDRTLRSIYGLNFDTADIEKQITDQKEFLS